MEDQSISSQSVNVIQLNAKQTTNNPLYFQLFMQLDIVFFVVKVFVG